MTNEEKIRLVLETLGTDNVKQANRVLREMQEELTKVGEASSKAAGKGGVNGAGVLQLAYFIDDLQYGMRGIMNNIPGLIQQLGLGAGLAGVAGIAAVAIGQLVEKHPEWFQWSNKVKESLKELTDAIKAEEEAVKRQKEQVDKLGESTSKRIEDVLKLKEATEQLKDAEAKLAEDRKNAKATEEADKNVGALATEELNKQKEVIKSVITDAGLQKQVRDELTRQVEQSIPEIGGAQIDKESRRIAAERVPFFAKMEPDRQDKIAGTFRGRAAASLQERRGQTVQSEVEAIFGGLINPANQDELDRSMQGLDRFLPGVSRELRNVYRFDRENEAFDAGNDRWRRGGGAQRRAEEREFAAGERTGAAMLPNRGTMEEAQNSALAKDNFAREAADKARRDIMTGLADVLPDPVTLAAMRRGNAGIGVGAVNRMRALEATDQQALFGTFRNAGMNEGDAKRSVAEYMQQGNEAFAEFAQANGMNARNLSSGFKASQALLQKIMQDQQETQEVVRWMEAMMNMQNQPQAKPPNRVRN